MKKFLQYLLLACLFVTACKNQETPKTEIPTNLSQNENKGLKEIIAYYGGEIHFDKGTIPATANTKQKRIFEISLSNSKMLEEYAHISDLSASNMAWLMHKNLGADAVNYDEIHSILLFNDGKKVTTKYPVDDLEIVSKKMNFLNKVVELIKQKKYEELKSYINDKVLFDYNKDEVINNLIGFDPEYGNIKSFNPFGFKRNKTTDGKSILHLSGFMVREKKNNEFSIDVDMSSDKEEVLYIQYAL